MVVVLGFSLVHPLRVVLVPLALLLVGLPPRKGPALVLAAVLGGLIMVWPQGPLWDVERGWALLAGGWFLLTVAAWPGAPFVTRALAATAAAVATAAVVVAVLGSWVELDWTVSNHYAAAAESAGRVWGGSEEAERMVELAAQLPARLFPALQAIATVAGLAIAWWMYGRLAGRGEPLGRLTEFRFPDLLVWVLIAGVALLVLPVAEWADRLGGNLVFFMAALYALRGLAVLVALVMAMVGAQVPVLLVLAVVGLILYPIVAAGTLLLGVTDTWLDLRSGRGAVNDEG